MQRVIDNPMTFGDYPCADEPVIEQECPRCHRVWEGYDVDGEIIWEYEDIELDEDPMQNGMCVICAWKYRTRKDRMRYIYKFNLQCDVLEYWLDTNVISISSAAELWKILVLNQLDFLDEIIDDYIEDREKSGFVEWLMNEGVSKNG